MNTLRSVLLASIVVLSMVSMTPIGLEQASAEEQTVTVSDGPAYESFWQESEIQGYATRSDLSSPVTLDLEQGTDEIDSFRQSDSESGDISTQTAQAYLPETRQGGQVTELTTLPDKRYWGVHATGGSVFVSSPDDIQEYTIGTDDLQQAQDMGSNDNFYITGDGGQGEYPFYSLSRGGTFSDYYVFHGLDATFDPTAISGELDNSLQLRGASWDSENGLIYSFVTGDDPPGSFYTNELIYFDVNDGEETDLWRGGTYDETEPHGIDISSLDNDPNQNTRPYEFVTSNENDEYLVYRNGNLLQRFDAPESIIGADWSRHDGVASENTGRLYFAGTDNRVLYEATVFDEWGDTGGAQYSKSYPASEVQFSNVQWEGEAPQDLEGDGQIELSAGGYSLTSQSGDGTFTKSYNTQWSGSSVNWDIDFKNWFRQSFGTSGTPSVSDVSWDYEYYQSPGTIVSDPLSVGDAESFDSLEIAGSGNDVNVEFLDSDGNVVSSQSNVAPGSSVDISDAPVDASTQEVQVRVTMQSDGASTSSIDGWQLSYTSTDPAEISDTSATIAGSSTTDLSAPTEVGYTDTFTVEQTTQNISQVKWYVSGVEAQNDSVSGTGPFSFSTTWQSGQVGEQQVTAEVTGENGGVDTVSWTLQVENINAPDITGWNATVGGLTTEDVQVNTGVGSDDTFRITDISVQDNQEVQQVEWYVDQEQVLTQSAPPYEFSRTWQTTGQTDVTAEVVGLEDARSVKEWTLQVREIGIIGDNSGAASQGEVIEVSQTFRTFTGDGEDIDVDLSYNEDVLRLVSDNSSLSTTVTSGDSQTWEFQVTDSNYEEDPVTITATQGDRSASKTFSVTPRSGGLISGDGGLLFGALLGNTWLGVLVDLGDTTLYLIQTGLGLVLVGGVYAQHIGRLSIPVVGRELDRFGLWTKMLGAGSVGALVAGISIPWVAVTTAALGGVYWWRQR